MGEAINDRTAPETMLDRVGGSAVKVGGYTISRLCGVLWIANGDGEGGSFNEQEFEKVIDRFFWDNF